MCPLATVNAVIMESAKDSSFYVVKVPSTVFETDPETSIRSEFESIFRSYGEEVSFVYLRSFDRVRVVYPDPEQCATARANLKDHIFQGTPLQIRPITAFSIGPQRLELPEKTKMFLISPPASPPVGWEQIHEAPPTRMDFKLVSALASLSLPGEVQELQEGTDKTPSIVVVTPDDKDDSQTQPSVCREESNGPRLKMNALPRHFVQTSRPPLSLSS